MAWNDVSDRDAILKAVAEYDRLGPQRFHAQYGFAGPRTQALIVSSREYPSKAILGVAHGFQFPSLGPLRSGDFKGGEHTVRALLAKLDFQVRAPGDTNIAGESYRELRVGDIYTRAQLRDRFGINDATINNGVFPFSPSETWLFVTEKKTADRTQFQDRLVGDTLYWDGQTAGRTDNLIIEQERRGASLLVFYREDRYQHPDAGFRYEGRFAYREHSGAGPTHFVLERVQPSSAVAEVEAAVEEFVRGRSREGRRRSAAEIRGIERHAVDLAIAYYTGAGWAVKDVGETHSFDLLCLRADVELHVEVKGTTLRGERVVLTRNEVHHARSHPQVALFVVHGIEIETKEDGTIETRGGHTIVHDRWRIDDGRLDALAFEYTLPPEARSAPSP